MQKVCELYYKNYLIKDIIPNSVKCVLANNR